MGTLALRAVVGLAAIATLAACTSTTTGAAMRSTAPGVSSSVPNPAPSGRPTPASFAALEALLVSQVPAGYEVQPDDVGDTGPSDLAKAIRDDGRPGAARALKSEGFVRGYQRLWMNDADDQIIAFIYQFATSSGARAEYDRNTAQLTVIEPSARRFAVPGMPARDTTGAAAHTDEGYAAVVIAISGPLVMQITCNASTRNGLTERASVLARQQYRRL
jgi:hypothetical protein